ncbi:MAG: hypothetical protein HY897_09215 [Deltaproteobacteria bacterium]|nr:hypothetical protein [Deltaproteobacteria bacterium]
MKTNSANRRVVSAAAGQRGVALVLVLLMLTVLSSLGFMALYTSSIERDIDRAHRYRLFARNSTGAGVQMLAQQVIRSKGGKRDASPPSTSSLGVNRGDYQIHPVIGICYVLDHNCADPFSTNNDPAWAQDLCCFRTGRVRDPAGTILKPTALNDLLNDSYKVGIGRNFMIGGGSDEYAHQVFEFWIAGGGPARSISELRVLMKVGPNPKGGGASGTGYGSQAGINAS